MSAPAGILPYDSDDASIILRCDCTSLTEVSAAGGSEPNAGTNSFDTALGFKALTTSGGLRFTEPTGYAALDIAGQVSFEIESAAICEPNAAILSEGVDWAGNTYMLVLKEAGTANFMRLMMDSAERFFVGWRTASVDGGTSPSSSGIKATTLGKDRFSRVTLSWVGNKYQLFVNGIWVFTGDRNKYPAANIGTRIEILSGGGGLGNALVGYYARNLLVSTKPVSFASHPALKRVAIVGHSFAARARAVPTDSYRDHSIGQAIGAALNARGIAWNMPSDNSAIFYSSGATILRSGGNPLSTQVALAAAYKPDIAIYIGGTNDVINASWATNRAQVLVDIKLDIIDLMASARRIVVCNVPSTRGNSTNHANSQRDRYTLEINEDIATLPAWWDATYPARAGALVIADLWSALGGAKPTPSNFWGLALGTGNDLHPSSVGTLVMGREIARAVAQVLGNDL